MAKICEYPCEECGNMMVVKRPEKRFCSTSCATKARYRRTTGRQSLIRRQDKICPFCEKVFTPKRVDAIYCSGKCCQRRYREENRYRLSKEKQAWARANPEARKNHLRKFAEQHPDNGKERYARLKEDPDRYRARQESSHKYYEEHRDEILARIAQRRQQDPLHNYSYRHGRDWTELFEELWQQQGGRCYLCEDLLDRTKYRGIDLDHDHSCCRLGRSCEKCRRGLCCPQCNRLIGWAKDDPQRLRIIAGNLESANILVRLRMGIAD